MKKATQTLNIITCLLIFESNIGNTNQYDKDLSKHRISHWRNATDKDRQNNCEICPIPSDPIIDFNEEISNFIIEEKQIIIPNFPDAFNPSILRWDQNKFLLTFRTRDPITNIANLIGFITLDDNFQPIDNPTLLNIYGHENLAVSKAQGPRLIKFNNRPYIIYNNIYSDKFPESRRLIISKLKNNNDLFFIFDPKCILSYKVNIEKPIEKNWSPFTYNNHILLSYTLNPHLVFQYSPSSNSCKKIFSTKSDINWPWGEIHGGTPSLLDGDQYLGFFHSWIDIKSELSNGKKISHFFIGAYQFEDHAPFALTHISPKPIIGRTFYNSPEYKTWKPMKAVYPGGFIFDKKHIWLVYGRQDNECWVIKIDKEKLKKSLIPLSRIDE